MIIYFAGIVPKGDDENSNFHNWRNEFAEFLSHLKDVKVIDPYDRSADFDESDSMAVFGTDCRRIKDSDLIIVNARDTVGVGTSQELVIAKYFRKPVITVVPKDTTHRRSAVYFRGRLIDDWIHPFIVAFSDLILDKPEDLSSLTIEKIKKIKPKDISVIDYSIDYINKKEAP